MIIDRKWRQATYGKSGNVCFIGLLVFFFFFFWGRVVIFWFLCLFCVCFLLLVLVFGRHTKHCSKRLYPQESTKQTENKVALFEFGGYFYTFSSIWSPRGVPKPPSTKGFLDQAQATHGVPRGDGCDGDGCNGHGRIS